MTRALVIAVALTSVLADLKVRPTQQTFRSAADSVELDVAVMQGNKSIAGLIAADFEVTDNGVKQTILEVSRERQPIDVVMVVDISGSVQGELFAALARAVNSVRRRLRDGDRAEIVTFNSQILGRVPMTATNDIKGVTLGAPVGSTSLNDAIIVSMAAPAEIGRRRMAIVFTDGYDTASFLDEPAALDVAARSHTAMFMVSTDSRAQDFFSKLVELTGGVAQIMPVFTPGLPVVFAGQTTVTFGPTGDVLDASFLRALDDFRTSYVVRYSLTGVTRSGWHDVAVRVLKSGRYQVRAKKGYIF